MTRLGASMVLMVGLLLACNPAAASDGDPTAARELLSKNVGLVVRTRPYLGDPFDNLRHTNWVKGIGQALENPKLTASLALSTVESIHRRLVDTGFESVSRLSEGQSAANLENASWIVVCPLGRSVTLPFNKETRQQLEDHDLSGLLILDQTWYYWSSIDGFACRVEFRLVDKFGVVVMHGQPSGNGDVDPASRDVVERIGIATKNLFQSGDELLEAHREQLERAREQIADSVTARIMEFLGQNPTANR